MEHYSYGILVLLLILTGAGLPLPEEVPIIYAGVASSAGNMNVWIALACCFVGALVGDCVLYGIGYKFGHGLAMRHPRIAEFLHADREARVEKWIKCHGLKVLFVARFLVFVRAPVYLAAGVLRMPVRQFVLVDMVCAGSVVGTFFGLAYLYGEEIRRKIQGFELLLTIVVVVCVVAALAWTLYRGRRTPPDGVTVPPDEQCQPADATGHEHGA